MIREKYLKNWVEHQKCLQQILFIPEEPQVPDPRARVFLGQKYVVYVNDHPRFQDRQDTQVHVIHIGADLGNVRPVDEEDVVLA